ncbi:prolyl oligopeptidase family serine peptidase [Deinococcus sp. SDU3-2]|uniref:Prolyl oligopeptidase family serine peptidase n=1 Tax=Deinococcus terrestris TaxID=2651870 RepID=A0A7X1NX07_9DEIO|nr:prolyl oligopeptidase family serine peptidase [Deinococcus terrestris]MPY67024.1 prolyl oligopeptidase family serine peptidase [Deinococcus terrestris]
MTRPLALALLGALTLAAPAGAQSAAALAKVDAAQMSIPAARQKSYPGSTLTVRQTLAAGVNYRRYVVSYLSEGLRINALLTVPNGTPPKGGWPAIVFNHGYIPPNVYRTTERYVAYQDAFARAGFVTLKSDYRGHGSSQGEALGGYFAPGYTTDVMNALGSLKRDSRVNAARIGMWGHSMGGFLTLRAMAIDPTIKAGVIWAGVVADYDGIMNDWNSPVPASIPRAVLELRQKAVAKYGTPGSNPAFWNKLSANSYLKDLGGPLQLHIGTADEDVPVLFHERLAAQMKAVGKPVQSYVYPGDNHDLTRNLGTALARSVAFFKARL